MPERLFMIAISAWKLRIGTYGNRPDIASGVFLGWSESPAMAREAGEARAKHEMPAAKGFRDHAAVPKEMPEARLLEWAAKRGFVPASVHQAEVEALQREITELRAENLRLRKRGGGRERRLALLEDET